MTFFAEKYCHISENVIKSGITSRQGGINLAKIIPFKGMRYNAEKVGGLKNVVTPPYDIISAEQQSAYYEKHKNSVIRLEYGAQYPTDNEADNRYTRAASFLHSWLDDGTLKLEDKESLYLYEQRFVVNGQELTYRGFITLTQLVEFSKGIVLPHEETLSKAKTDRFNLMDTTHSNFSQVYCLYIDEERKIDAIINKITSAKPDISFISDEDNIEQNLWIVSDDSVIKSVQDGFSDKQLFIADGHHRYETALNFRNKMREENPDWKEDDLFNYVMMMLVDMDDSGLVVFPTHRLVNNVKIDEVMAVSLLKDNFNIDKIIVDKKAETICKAIDADLMALREKKGFALYFGDEYYYRLTLNDASVMSSRLPDKSDAYRNLDVTILHTLILDDIFGIDSEDLANQSNLTYTRDALEAIEAVQSGAQQCTFILNPTKVREIKDVSLAGEKMPQKSTYFYPKLITGLVMNKF